MALDLKSLGFLAVLLGLDTAHLKEQGKHILKDQSRTALRRRIQAHEQEIVERVTSDNKGLSTTDHVTAKNGNSYTQLEASTRDALYWTFRKVGMPGEVADLWRDDEEKKVMAAVVARNPTTYAEVVRFTIEETLDQLF